MVDNSHWWWIDPSIHDPRRRPQTPPSGPPQTWYLPWHTNRRARGHSAGLLPYRRSEAGVLVFIAHMGGPFWAARDARAWSVIKGEYAPGAENAQAAAAREFAEEIGAPAPQGEWVELGQVRQSSGKVVTAFAVPAPESLEFIESNLIEVQWPPRSGRTISVPEVDRAQWMPVADARGRLVAKQEIFLDRLVEVVGE